MYFVLLLLLLTAQKVEAFQCHECMGVDVSQNQKLEDYIKKSLKTSLDGFITTENDQCLASLQTQDAVECQTVCLSVTAIGNLENYGGPEEAEFTDEGEVYDMNRNTVRNLGSPKVAIRTCLDSIFKHLNISDLQEFLNVFPEEEACLKMSMDVVGVNAETEFCACPTEFCNNNPVKSSMPAGAAVNEMNDADFTEECPPIVVGACPENNCAADTDCDSGQKCCAHQCGFQCKNTVNARSFAPYSCSNATYQSSKLKELFDGLKEAVGDGVLIPESSSSCEKDPVRTTQNCKTLGIRGDAKLSLAEYYGPELPEEHMMELLGVNSTATFGNTKMTIRGCLDKIMPDILNDGFPKIANGDYCGRLEGTVFGAGFSTGICACNSDNCNIINVQEATTPKPTPVNGGWSAWVRKRDCQHNCDEGKKEDIRYCNNPVPAHGGVLCESSDGQNVVSKEELSEPCPCEPGVATTASTATPATTKPPTTAAPANNDPATTANNDPATTANNDPATTANNDPATTANNDPATTANNDPATTANNDPATTKAAANNNPPADNNPSGGKSGSSSSHYVNENTIFLMFHFVPFLAICIFYC